jgi:hypothetical protein
MFTYVCLIAFSFQNEVYIQYIMKNYSDEAEEYE